MVLYYIIYIYIYGGGPEIEPLHGMADTAGDGGGTGGEGETKASTRQFPSRSQGTSNRGSRHSQEARPTTGSSKNNTETYAAVAAITAARANGASQGRVA